jgi:ubiquitin-protein ligase E3 C
MFPNFTGSSRRTRNVNLSGQRAVNPFTNPSWTSSSPAGASKTVAHAQAERQQRQRERERLQATLRIQRLWRAHQVRRRLRTSRRQLLDQLYAVEESDEGLLQRSVTALPLLLAVYQGSEPGDRERLRWVAQDLVRTDFGAFTTGAVPPPRMNKLVKVLIAALERYAARGRWFSGLSMC